MAADSRRWHLGDANGWGARLRCPADAPVPVLVTARDLTLGATIRLAERPDGPRSPYGSMASLGQLVPPQNVSLDGGTLLLASRRRRRVLRFDRAQGVFRSWLGLEPFGPAEEDDPDLILCRADGLLMLAERGRPEILALEPNVAAVFDRRNLDGDFVVDVEATAGPGVMILGRSPRGDSHIWHWEPGGEAPVRRWVVPENPAGPALNPTRIIRDAQGHLYVFDAATARVLAFAATLDPVGWVPLANLRDRFEPLPFVIEPHPGESWRMRIPPAGTPLPYPWPAPVPWPAFDPDGHPLTLEPHAPVGPPPFVARGTVEIGPLNGFTPRANWDRLEIALTELPRGTVVSLRSRTSDTPARPDEADAPWSPWSRVTESAGRETPLDFALRSPPGQFLWLELTLEGGASSPAIDAVGAVGPRGGMVDFLPLVFREMDLDTRFLERLVGALERTWDPLEQAVNSFDRELRAETAGEPMLDYLAAGLDEPLQPGWTVRAKRFAVEHGSSHLHARGTPAALQSALRLFLANRWNVPPQSLGAVPFLWEHFRSRRPLHLDSQAGEDAGQLFGSEVLHRLRLGSSTMGEGRLWEAGSPETDPVTRDAHRFSVFVPRMLLPDEADLRGFRNVLSREQPVEASGDIVLIEPRFRLGVQATLGVDTLLGTSAPAGLAGAEGGPPGVRLDRDTLLADPVPGPRPGTQSLPWRIT